MRVNPRQCPFAVTQPRLSTPWGGYRLVYVPHLQTLPCVDEQAKYSGNGILEGQKLALLGCDWPRDQGRCVSLCLKCVSEIHIKYLPRWYKPFFISLINWVPACFFEQWPNQLCVS